MKKPPKITYLLGAGASYNALPIVNELVNVAKGMLEYFNQTKTLNPGKSFSFNIAYTLIDEVAKHHSIDTLARKIWLKNKGLKTNEFNEEYTRIINLITAILYFKQIRKNQRFEPNIHSLEITYKLPKRKFKEELVIDPRYEAFFAAILKEDCSIPDNFNFISWNYDFQVEKTLHYYNSDKRISEIAEETGINYKNFQITNNSSQIIKLNGTSFFMSNSETIDATDYNMHTQGILIDALSDNTENLKSVSSLIKFAWENESEIKNHHAIASEKIKESDFVVVIGYSFPIFNRQVDIDLFKDFKNGKSKIIIQAPESDVHQYIEQLESIKSGLSKVATPFTNLEQFYIPSEYWTEPHQLRARSKSYK